MKRLWELSEEPELVDHVHDQFYGVRVDDTVVEVGEITQSGYPSLEHKPKGEATVMQDDPLDIFPSDESELEQQPGS